MWNSLCGLACGAACAEAIALSNIVFVVDAFANNGGLIGAFKAINPIAPTHVAVLNKYSKKWRQPDPMRGVGVR